MPHRVSGAEFARLTSLYRYGVLGRACDPAIDETVRALASRFDVPVAQLVLADAQQFWVMSAVGPGERMFLSATEAFSTTWPPEGRPFWRRSIRSKLCLRCRSR